MVYFMAIDVLTQYKYELWIVLDKLDEMHIKLVGIKQQNNNID